MTNIVNPSLPRGKVRLAAVGNYPIVINKLNECFIDTIVIKDSQVLPPPVYKHADMQLLLMPQNRLFLYDTFIEGFDCTTPKQSLGKKYPFDILLNCLILRNYLICNTRYCAKEVICYASDLGIKVINVKQGYARCSCALVDDNSLITADRSIKEALTGEGFEVLLIKPGYFELPGYEYGFIGGSCGKISKDKILFSGDFSKHPDCREIQSFVEAQGVEIVYCSDCPAFDFGGFIPLKEEL